MKWIDRERLKAIGRWAAANALLTVVSLWLGYRCGVVEPKISYAVASLRPIVFDPAFAPEVSALFGEEVIDRPIYRMQVWVWNRGSELVAPPFRRPPRLRTQPPVRILRARMLRQSFADCNFRIDDRRAAEGIIGLNWDALAYRDGAAMEILYTGLRDATVHIDGAWSSQHLVKRVSFFRLSNDMLGILAFLVVSGIFILSAAMARGTEIVPRFGAFALWVMLMYLLGQAVLYGIPRAIDVDYVDRDAVSNLTPSPPAL